MTTTIILLCIYILSSAFPGNVYKKLSNNLNRHKVNIVTYKIGEEISLRDIVISETHREIYGEDTMKSAFTVKTPNRKIAYLGSGMLHYKTRDLAEKMIFNADTVIFGAHGKAYSPTYDFYTVYPLLKSIIISSDNFHLSGRAEKQYKENSTEVLKSPGTVRLKR